MIVLDDGPTLRETVALACRVLASKGLAKGILGHVSARVSDNEMVIRCRGPGDPGLWASRARDIWRVTLDGDPVDVPDGFSAPKELCLHGELLRRRPDLGAVVHAHPWSALLCGLAGLEPRAVLGAYNIPAARMALKGIPVYARPVLIAKAELAAEMVAAMGEADVCLLRGHGVAVGGQTVEQAAVRTLDLNALYDVTVDLARLGACPPGLSDADLAELPDLGSAFNDTQIWNAIISELPKL